MKPLPGQHVHAFHPRMLGVVKQATVVSVGTKYAKLDFGLLGVWKVPFRDVLAY